MKGTTRRVAAILLLFAAATAAPAVAAAPDIRADFRSGRALVLQFTQPMQTWENERRADVVTLQPALPTQCAWDSDTQLSCAFQGDARPALATRYRIAIAAGLKTQSGETLPARVLHAETDRPTLAAAIEAWKQGLPEILITSSAKAQSALLCRVPARRPS